MDGFATLFLMVSHGKIGTSAIQTRATAGVAGATYIFCLPGSPGACKDAWDEILVHQLDYRYGPCNFVEIMPRLAARQGEGRDRLGASRDCCCAQGYARARRTCGAVGIRCYAVRKSCRRGSIQCRSRFAAWR